MENPPQVILDCALLTVKTSHHSGVSPCWFVVFFIYSRLSRVLFTSGSLLFGLFLFSLVLHQNSVQ